MKSPAFQFYPADWLSSSQIMLMTPAQEGAYIRLLALAWGNEDCGLPDDDKQLAVLSRLGEEWFKGGSDIIRKCFFTIEGRLFNRRLLEERKKQHEWRMKSSQGGIKSGQVRNKLKEIKKLSPEGWLKGGATKREPKGNSSSSFSFMSLDKENTFVHFWNSYPKKKAKADAMKAWNKLELNNGLFEEIMQALNAHKKCADWLKNGGQFIPFPATWINGKRWEDETVKEKSAEEALREELYGTP